MKRWLLACVVTLLAMLTMESMGQTPSPVITAFQRNGGLTWTNRVNPYAIYRVERTPQLSLPFSFPVATETAGSRSTFTVTDEVADASAFYRVEMSTTWPEAMVWIEGGDVELGTSTPNQTANPVHTNFVSGFWMDATEVTKAKWDEVRSWGLTHGYTDLPLGSGSLPPHAYSKGPNHPVHNLDWYDCVKWCNARSQKEGFTPCYYTDAARSAIYKTGTQDIDYSWVNWNTNGYRLPTEAEWEKAARGGRQRRLFPWGGDTIQHARANYKASTNENPKIDTSPTQGFHPAYTNGVTPYTSPVGSFPANGYGLYDMAGNVFEWCWDWYVEDYPSAYQIDPLGPANGQWRVYRGGAWEVGPKEAQCWMRNRNWPDYGEPMLTYGFRCVRRGPPGLGYALAFDINNSKVMVPYQAAMNAYPLTLTAWVRTRETNSTYRGIVDRVASSANTNGYTLVTRYGRVQAQYARSDTQYVRNGTEPLDGGFVADGNWHHVAFVVDAGGGKLYVDGQLGASNAWTGAAGACTLDRYLSLGSWGAIPLSGALDEVTIWSTARSQADIQTSMHQPLLGNEAGLLGYWRLDEGSGTNAVNSSIMGASLNGTLVHGPTWVVSGVPVAP